jgi:ubiquinone/menaquinone biosynthesis C-methylase UbiE
MVTWSLDQAYDAYPKIEEQFSADLDQSLEPRGPGLLLDLVAGFDLPAGATAVDVGCGAGAHAIRLAGRFGFSVTGIDPVPSQIEAARAAAGPAGPDFRLGIAEQIPLADAVADLIWCRDVLVHVTDQRAAYAEFRRVLKPAGRALVYQMFGTDWLEPREAAWLWDTMGVIPQSADPSRAEQAIAAAGLRIDQRIVLGTEWGEWAAEHQGKGGRKLLHAARLLRGRDSYVERYGQAAYDMMLGDCLWHVYGMIGKLDRRVYVLSQPAVTGR